MSFTKQALTVLKRILIVLGIAVAFSVGLVGAIILSLYSSQTRVPDVVGKDRATAEDVISAAHLNFRVRATRPVSDAKPNTVLIQIPSAGQEVKVGQTVAVDISRSTKEGESSASTTSNANTDTGKKSESDNATNSAANSNDNKPKRNPVNKNSNGNANANRASNQNRSVNANLNANANPAETPVRSNLNSNSAPKGNANRGVGDANRNRRAPVAAPTP